MTQFILVRHGEPRYDEVEARRYFGLAYNYGKLTSDGVLQAKTVANNPLLKDADLIIASPYTRALQTASIISRKLNLELEIELDLHELNIDKTLEFKLTNWNVVIDEYREQKGIRNEKTKYPWESYEELQTRVNHVLDKYKNYKKVIVVCHEFVISSQTKFGDQMEYCGIREVWK